MLKSSNDSTPTERRAPSILFDFTTSKAEHTLAVGIMLGANAPKWPLRDASIISYLQLLHVLGALVQ